MSAHHWVKPSCELLQVLQNTPKGDIRVVRIEEHTENGLSSTGILNHLGGVGRALEHYQAMHSTWTIVSMHNSHIEKQVHNVMHAHTPA